MNIYHEARDLYGFPRVAFALFSGGNDSLCATHVAFSLGIPNLTALHIDTGTGVPETRAHVEATCVRQGWPLKIVSASDAKQSYVSMVLKWGFPGPGFHGRMYQRLKERPLRLAIKQARRECRRRRGKTFLFSGCRLDESIRRMGTTERMQKRGSWIWLAPIYDWSKERCEQYMDEQDLVPSPVVDKLGMSGECLCGAFASPGELRRIERCYPHVGARIRDLERQVFAAGHTWGWNDRPTKAQPACDTVPVGQSLCHSCPKNREARHVA